MVHYNFKDRLFSIIMVASLMMFFVEGVFANSNSNVLESAVQSKIAGQVYGNFDVSANSAGKISIKGQVNSLYDKLLIFQLASEVPGVHGIYTDIDLNTSTLPDRMIEANILQDFKRASSLIESNRVDVKSDNGVVFLTGIVSTTREKLAAETIASWQSGVKGISNEIKVLSPEEARSDGNLRIYIHALLSKEFPLHKKLNYQVMDGTVVLNGTVYSHWDKDRIEKELKKISGVNEVINRLEVNSYIS